ncbi:hypothetical protein V6N11_035494 [Hibiscus sabdariffa]|uniref:Uncharacterized protein n=1 Tax=Hibiscus sabdariffa TaxID=183260 RepID=A0ABR2R137_9ROSI
MTRSGHGALQKKVAIERELEWSFIRKLQVLQRRMLAKQVWNQLVYHARVMVSSTPKWVKPPIRWVKANADGVIRVSDDAVACGDVIQDENDSRLFGALFDVPGKIFGNS